MVSGSVDSPMTCIAIYKPSCLGGDLISDHPTAAIRRNCKVFSLIRICKTFSNHQYFIFIFQSLPGSLLDFKVDELGVVAVMKNASGCGIQLLNVLPACNHCKRLNGKSDQLKKCSRCRSALYCSKECQIADWSPHHKAICSVARST